MAGLTVKGDPNGWLDAGRSVSTLANQLDGELSDANTFGGQALGRSWYGPAASAFAADWNARRSRYEDLIYNVRQTAQAITQYGQRLADMALQAGRLEATYCSLGLHILESGGGFMLPPGIGSMSPGTQLHLMQTLAESVTEVAKLGTDAITAADDLGRALGAATVALLDFGLIEVGILGSVARGVANDWVTDEIKDPFFLLREALDADKTLAEEAADDAAKYAAKISASLRAGDSAGATLPQAGRDSRAAAATASDIDGVVKYAGPATLIAANVVPIAIVMSDARSEGYRQSLEQNADLIASAATDDAIAYFAPEVFADPGTAMIANGIVAAGVGYTVQSVVDHRKAIGHFVESVL